MPTLGGISFANANRVSLISCLPEAGLYHLIQANSLQVWSLFGETYQYVVTYMCILLPLSVKPDRMTHFFWNS